MSIRHRPGRRLGRRQQRLLELVPSFGSAGDINNRGQILGGLGGTTSAGQPVAHTLLWSTRRT